MLFERQHGLAEAWACEAQAADAHWVRKTHQGKAEIAELRRELDEERLRAQRRRRHTVDQGEKALAAATGTDVAGKSQEAAVQAEAEERRLRQALARTSRQLDGHKALNSAFDVAIARSLEEKESHIAALQEGSHDLERLRSEHSSLLSELREERAERAAIRQVQALRATEDEAKLAKLWASTRDLAAEAKTEETMLAEVSMRHCYETDEQAHAIAACQERLIKARACADKGAEGLLRGLAKAKAEMSSSSRPASHCQKFARAEMNAAVRQYKSEQHLAKLLLTDGEEGD